MKRRMRSRGGLRLGVLDCVRGESDELQMG
jgi:hypothetical protein